MGLARAPALSDIAPAGCGLGVGAGAAGPGKGTGSDSGALWPLSSGSCKPVPSWDCGPGTYFLRSQELCPQVPSCPARFTVAARPTPQVLSVVSPSEMTSAGASVCCCDLCVCPQASDWCV